MRSIVVSLLLALATLSIVPNALAADVAGGDFFLDAKYGKTFGKLAADSSEYSNNARSNWAAEGGYLWNLDDAHSLGFDVGYVHFGNIAKDYLRFGNGEISASAVSLGGHLQVRFGVDSAWYFQGRIGLMNVRFDEPYSVFVPGPPVTTGTDSWRHSSMYFGLGIGRYITHDFSLNLTFSRYNAGGSQNGAHPDLDLNWIDLGAEYRF